MNEVSFYHLLGSGGLSTSLSAQVAGEIGRRIVAGVYRCGDLVHDEDAMAKLFRVSRTVVREAIKIISAKGMLNVRRGIGARVTPRRQWRLLDDDVLAWHQSAPASAKTLNQLMDVRLSLEPAAAGWAAQRADKDDLCAITTAVTCMEKEAGNREAFVTADAAFHRAVLYSAHNEFILELEGVIYTALLTSIRLTNKTTDENKDSILLHRAVADAIAARDQSTAQQRMRRLLDDASDRLSERVPDYPYAFTADVNGIGDISADKKPHMVLDSALDSKIY